MLQADIPLKNGEATSLLTVLVEDNKSPGGPGPLVALGIWDKNKEQCHQYSTTIRGDGDIVIQQGERNVGVVKVDAESSILTPAVPDELLELTLLVGVEPE